MTDEPNLNPQNWIAIRIHRPDGYEDVAPELVAEDFISNPSAWSWELAASPVVQSEPKHVYAENPYPMHQMNVPMVYSPAVVQSRESTLPELDEGRKWEYFNDPAYYDMWCARPIGSTRFGEGFHVASESEARAMCEYMDSILNRNGEK